MLLLATFTIIPSPFILLHLHHHHTCACYLYHTCTRICMFMCQPLGRRPHWSTTGGPPTSDNGHQWSPYQAIPTTCTIQWSHNKPHPLHVTSNQWSIYPTLQFPSLGASRILGVLCVHVDSVREYKGLHGCGNVKCRKARGFEEKEV